MDMEMKATIARLERELKQLKHEANTQIYSKLHCPVCGRKKKVVSYTIHTNKAGNTGYYMECEDHKRFRIIPCKNKPFIRKKETD